MIHSIVIFVSLLILRLSSVPCVGVYTCFVCLMCVDHALRYLVEFISLSPKFEDESF